MISEAFSAVLRSNRSDYNRRYNEARKRFPGLNHDAFNEFLANEVNELIAAVSLKYPDRIDSVCSAAYDAGLELVGQNLAGHGSRHVSIQEGWRQIFPVAVAHIAEKPDVVIPSLSNALYVLSITPGARPAQWISNLVKTCSFCTNADMLLKVGQLAAWTAGLSQYRASALGILDILPEQVARTILDVPSAAHWETVRERLQNDPWFVPSLSEKGSGQLRVALQAGSFRGFGGLFLEPPQVARNDEHFIVSSAGESWLLLADLYGATFHRALPEESGRIRKQAKAACGLEVSGTVIRNLTSSLDLPVLGGFTSWACDEHTLVLTSSLTHSVTLVALT